MPDEEIISWFEEHFPELYILYSHNFVDFNEQNDYLKRSAMLSYIDSLKTE